MSMPLLVVRLALSLLVILSVALQAQPGTQSNSSAASLTFQGQSTNLNVQQGEVVNCLMAGQPGGILLLANGLPALPGPSTGGAGFLNLATFDDLILNGFVYTEHRLDVTGQWMMDWQVPWLTAVGHEVTTQGAVEDTASPLGFTLTAPTTFTVTSTNVQPANLFFDPAQGEQGVQNILPPAGTLPGDLPMLEATGFPGQTNVFGPGGRPVHGVFQSPFYCYSCHGGSDDIWSSYMGTMMANSMRDPLFNGQFSISLAAMEYLKQQGESPLGADLAADFCIRCHGPNAWQGGRSGFTGDGVTTAYTPGVVDHTYGLDMEGVVCDVCHRTESSMPGISPTAGVLPGQPENAQLVISQAADAKRGPYSGTYQWQHLGGTTAYGALIGPLTATNTPPIPHLPPGQPGSAVSPGHDTEFGQNLGESSFCGTCHNITHPLNGHAVERTYSEWLYSDYSDPNGPDYQSCQDCHMPPQSNVEGCTLQGSNPTYGAWNKVRSALRQHEFVGGNAWIPQILKQMYPDVDQPWTSGQNFSQSIHFGPPSRSPLWDTVTMRATQKLRDAAQVDLVASEPTPGTLSAGLTITNLTGHKLPTGYSEGRQMWIQVEALDANDVPFYQSGMLDANSALTPHVDLKIYEARHGLNYPNLGLSGPSHHFGMHNMVWKDNRIPPKGAVLVRGKGGTDAYDPVLAPWPAGGLYPNNQHWDTTGYTITVPPGTARPLKVRATVLYQTSSWEYVEFLANGGDSVVQTTPHPDALTVRDLWLNGYPAPGLPVGVVGPSSTADPQSQWPGQTAMVILP